MRTTLAALAVVVVGYVLTYFLFDRLRTRFGYVGGAEYVLLGMLLGPQAANFLSADVVLAWPLVAPPDLPAERVQELRTAFLAMMKDPELRAEAAKLKLEVAPVPGQEMQELIEQLYGSPPDVIELVKKINSAQ